MKKVDFWFPPKNFPDTILSKRLYLTLHNTSEHHINEIMKLLKKNYSDIASYLDINYCFTPKDIVHHINFRNELFQKRICAEYAIYLKDKKYIGTISLITVDYKTLSISYYLDKDYRNHGYMTEALQACEKESQQMGFEKIMLEINKLNSASINVAKRNNYNLQQISDGSLMQNYIKQFSK